MKKGLLLSLIFATMAVNANNLRHYRREILRPLGTTENMSTHRLREIRRALGTQGLPAIEMQRENSQPRPPRSATIVKDALLNATREIQRAQRLDASLVFNPSWTRAEHQQILLIESRKRCLRSIQNSRLDAHGRPAGIEAVLKELVSKILKDTDVSGAAATPDVAVTSKSYAGALLEPRIENSEARAEALIARHLRAAPTNRKHQSITDVLGEVQAVEFSDGFVDRIQMGPAEREVYLSLNMLLTYRTGQDDAFVQAQDCLFEYLKDQREVFRRRAQEEKSANLFSAAYHRLVGWWEHVSKFRGEILRTAKDKAQAKAEVREMYGRIQTSDGAAQDLAKFNFFTEDHALGSDHAAQIKFIKERLALSNHVVPYLESRVPKAHRVSEGLKALASAQIDYLLDMFLQLNGKDLPTVQDSAGMGEIFAAQASDVATDAMYYGVLGQQLTELQGKLEADQMDAAARIKDLEQIRR